MITKSKKNITMKPYVSSCCKGGFLIATNKKGKEFYKCLVCNKDCKIEPFKKPQENIQKRAESGEPITSILNESMEKKKWSLVGELTKIGLNKAQVLHTQWLVENLLKKERDIPMGVSDWRAYGKKFGYWKYFRESFIKELETILSEWKDSRDVKHDWSEQNKGATIFVKYLIKK